VQKLTSSYIESKIEKQYRTTYFLGWIKPDASRNLSQQPPENVLLAEIKPNSLDLIAVQLNHMTYDDI